MAETENRTPNRRQSERHKVKLRILFQRAGAAHFVNAETDNISVDGVHIWSERRPLEVGTEVSILIRFENVNADLQKVLSDALQSPEPPPTQ